MPGNKKNRRKEIQKAKRKSSKAEKPKRVMMIDPGHGVASRASLALLAASLLKKRPHE